MSELVELAGFVCLAIFGFLFGDKAGFAVTGCCLLIIGYSLNEWSIRSEYAKQKTRWTTFRNARKVAKANRKAEVK